MLDHSTKHFPKLWVFQKQIVHTNNLNRNAFCNCGSKHPNITMHTLNIGTRQLGGYLYRQVIVYEES